MIGRLIQDRRGSAAIEFALSLPMMLALMFVGMEAGHFFWTEHKLVKAVRDGARFAARSQVDDLCNGGTAAIEPTLATEIRNLTATGQVADGGGPKVPGWNADDVTITVGCQQFVATGIYTDLGTNGPLITVSSGAVTYPSILNGLGVLDDAIVLSAESSAAVMGI
jgi:Flp pilus assembly protein TadG